MSALRKASLTLVILTPLLLAIASATTSAQGNPNPGVLPIQSHAYGKTYGEWSVAWWQWAYSIQVSNNPLFDETGADVAVGQSGHVWFLAGIDNVSGKAVRTVTIPAGKALFLPILNAETDNIGVSPPHTVPQLYIDAATIVATTIELHASIDGKPVQDLSHYRAVSPVFAYTLPATDNIYQYFGTDVSGTIDPAVSDGYWLMLAPLSVGHHDLNFGGTFGPPINFTLDITYHITVTP